MSKVHAIAVSCLIYSECPPRIIDGEWDTELQILSEEFSATFSFFLPLIRWYVLTHIYLKNQQWLQNYEEKKRRKE